MFDPERLLGQVMNEALSGGLGGSRRKRRRQEGFLGGLSTGSKAKLGLGVLALAYAAYEHFRQPAAAPAATPPPPPTTAVPPPPPPQSSPRRGEPSLHLIRAMICAASADGLIDPQERQALLARAREAGFGDADLAALDAEMSAPLTLEQLVARTPADLRDETYAAALLAIAVDTEEETRFLDRLATQLQLDAGAQQDIRQQLGL